MPLYLKSHSQGEYVFDHSWADAYERAGGRYYPKLQCSAPFSPVTGPRLIVRPDIDVDGGALGPITAGP
jgi:predicted N-acyltransferase